MTAYINLLSDEIVTDSLIDLRSYFNSNAGIFIRTINYSGGNLYLTVNYDNAEDYLLISTNFGRSFTTVAYDTTPYKIYQDSFGPIVRIYDYDSRSPFSRGTCIVDSKIFISKTKGIISTPDYESGKFINDTIASQNSNFNFIENNSNQLLTCSEKNVMLSTNLNDKWNVITPLPHKYIDTSLFDLIYRKAIFSGINNLYLLGIIQTKNAVRLDNIILKSTDNGASWNTHSKIPMSAATVNDIFIKKDGTLYVCGFKEYDSDRPVKNQYEWLSRFDLQSNQWIDLISDSTNIHFTLNRVKFRNDKFGIAHGSSNLYYTFDGGDKWSRIFAPDEFDMGVIASEFIDDRSLMLASFRTGILKKVTLKTPTNVEIEKSDLILYPNPVTDFINIDLSNLYIHSTQVSIINLMGDLLMTENLNDNKILRLNVSKLKRGFYTINVGKYSTFFIKD